MKLCQRHRALAVCAVAALAVSPFAGCGGGGGGGGGVGSAPVLLAILSQEVVPLWQSVNGVPVPNPACAPSQPLNSVITFIFGGPVDPATLPSGGQAIGSINITAVQDPLGTPTTIAALGSFSVSDDPSLPVGNQRIVRFTPILPFDPTNPTAAGMNSNLTYTIFVPAGGGGGQSVRVAGQNLTTEAVTCFNTCNTTPNPSLCFSDQISGDPFVVASVPASVALGGAAPIPMVDPSAVTANTVTIFVSEPLDPTNVNIDHVKLVNAATGAQTPGTVVFSQTGTFTPPAGVSTMACRIDYQASSQLLANVTYSITFDATVTDFGQNPVRNFDLPSTVQPDRVFATISVPFCPQPAKTEDFTTVAQLDPTSATELLTWGGGRATVTFPLPLVGDGSDGAVVYAPGNHDVYTGGLITPTQTAPFTVSPCAAPPLSGTSAAFDARAADGILNAMSVNVMSGANLRVYGAFPLHWRVLGAVTIAGRVDGSAFRPTDPGCYSTFRAGAGQFNNGGTTAPNIVNPSIGGPGAGRGGRASQNGLLRTDRGESGQGAFIGGSANLGQPQNDFFGGGQGGLGDFFVAAAGQQGGQGGAGGSAFVRGNNGIPLGGSVSTGGTGSCLPPLVPPPQTPADAALRPASFEFPIAALTAGSGGGAGGDKFDPPGVTLMDEQGGAGGGGGGGFRISAVGTVTLANTAEIRMDGAAGSIGPTFTGAGGAGSGGLIWLQTFQQLIVPATATMSVAAGGGPTGTLSCVGAPGAGGVGLIQLEDSDGIVNTAFIGSPCGNNCNPILFGHNVGVVDFPFSTTVGGAGTSIWLDTGYGDPRYTGAMETKALGTVVGGTATVRYQGAFESVSNPGTPDLAAVSPWITANQISADPLVIDPLDGFRFVRFMVEFTYPAPPASQPTDIFPEVSFVSISFEAPIGCP